MEQPVANADYPTELDHSRALDFPEGTINPCTRKTTRVFRSISNNTTTEINNVLVPNNQSSRAYLLVRLLRDTLFGRVHNVRVLRRRTAAVPADGQADWEITDEQCVIQEMEWATIQESRGRRADDPIKYFSAMQYLHDRMQLAGDDANNGRDYVIHSVDKLTDGICLFLVLPFFNGGELFDRIAAAERFTEGQARIYIRQILREIAVLQSAGICNCDISLENIMLHNVSCKIISLGMSLLIPYRTVKDGDVVIENDAENITHRGIGNASQVRLLLSPAGRKGNRLYMPPEIYNNVVPFDGFAVDLWAVGIMLFIMVTGFPPWDNPSLGDDKFRYMTGGFMVRLLTEWELGLSREVMDLLQKMLYRDPTERLCLQQILEHAWFNQD